MATSLENQYIDESYQKLVQIEGTALSDGTGSAVTELDITATNATTAVSASHAISASHALDSDKLDGKDAATFATTGSNTFTDTQAINKVGGTAILAFGNVVVASGGIQGNVTGSLQGNADTATTASYAENANLPSGTISGSAQISDLGFVQSDITGSSVITGSVNGSNLTFTKGDGTTFDLLVTAPPSISASYAETATSASWAQRAYFAETVEWTGINNKPTVVSGSSQITLVDTTGDLPATRITGVITSASHALKADTADSATSADSVAYANITGKPTLVSGSSQITLADATGNLDGARITGTVSNATNAVSASIANTATTAVLATSAVSASHAVIADTALTANTATTATSADTATSASHAVQADNASTADLATLATTATNAIQSETSLNTVVAGKNLSGAELPKGTPVWFTDSGTQGNLVGLYPADASNPARMPAGGIVGETLGIGAEGTVLLDGFINGVDTSAFTAGDQVYVAVGGGYTNQRPTGSANLVQSLGYIEKSDINGSGVIQGPGESVDVPNIQSGFGWFGNEDGIPIAQSTGSFAKTDKNNVFLGTQTFDNISVNGTGSFAYIQSVTGSAKTIGDAFIILNNDTPTERYAGVVVQDSGSANTTASLQFDGQTNDWFYEYSDDGGVTTDHGAVLFGPEYSVKGTPTYPTNNTIQKGDGGHHLLDSSITDDGALVTVSNPLTVTGQITGDLTGNVTGNASSATTASYALTSANDGQWDGQYTGAAVIDGSLNVTGSFSNLFDVPVFAGGDPNTLNYDYILIGDGRGNTPFGGDGGEPFFIYGNNSFMPNGFRMGTRLSTVAGQDQNFVEINSLGFKGSYYPSASGEVAFFEVGNADGPAGNVSQARLQATTVNLGQIPVGKTGPNYSRNTNINIGVKQQYGPTDFYYTTNVNTFAASASYDIKDRITYTADEVVYSTNKFTVSDQGGLDFISQANVTFESISNQIQFLGDSSVQGDLTVTGVINGTLQGNAATATSASYAPLDTSKSNVWSNANLFEQRVQGSLFAAGTSGTINIDFSEGNFFTVTPTATATIQPQNVTNASNGQTVTIKIDNTSSQTISFSGIQWAGGTAPTITTGGIDLITLVSIGTTVYGTAVQNLS